MSCELTSETPQPVVMAQGQQCTLQLRSNPTTGYGWALLPIESERVRLLGSEFVREARAVNEPPRVGAGGVERFRLEAGQVGEVTLHWVYRRPWQPDEVAQRFELRISVR